MLDTGSPDFNQKTETILSVLYASDTVPIRRCALHGDKHEVFAALIVMMHEQSLQLEVNECNTTDLRVFGYSISFMQFLSKAEARFVLNVMMRTDHKAIYCVSDGVVETLNIRKVQHLFRKIDDDLRWLVALVSDTGMRLAESAGQLKDDIILDADIPHIGLKPHPWRPLKTSGS